MLKMANAEPRLMSGLQEAVLLLCKAGLKFESTLSVNGLLAITVDQKDVFLVNIKQTVGDLENRPTENKEIISGNSADDLEPEQSCFDYVEISNNCDQRKEQKDMNIQNSRDDTLNESRSCTDVGGGSGELKESNCRPSSVRRHSINRLKRPLNLPLQGRCKERQSDFASGDQQSSSSLKCFAEEIECAERDDVHEFPESSFDIQAPGINRENSDLENAIATTEVDHHLLCKIKQEPRCESHFAYQVSHPSEALSQSEIHHEEPTDYSQFSAHSYSVHHFLQSQAAAWSREAQSTLARTSSLHHNVSAATWPRRQVRSSDKSICVNCGTNTTTVWRRGKEGQLLCNACGCYYKLHKTHRPQSLMKDNIRRRSRRHQGLRWAVNSLPVSSLHNILPFPLAWNQEDVEQS